MEEDTKLTATGKQPEDSTSNAPVEGNKLPTQASDNESITLTRNQLKALVQEEVQKGLLGGFKRPKRVTERTARLRFYKGKPVVWYGNFKQVLDKLTGDKVGWIDIKTLGSKEAERVEYLAFLNSGLEEQATYLVLIKEQKAEEILQSQGRRPAENPDEAKINTKNWQPHEIELEVTSYRYTAVVEVSEGPFQGQTFTLPADCLNQ